MMRMVKVAKRLICEAYGIERFPSTCEIIIIVRTEPMMQEWWFEYAGLINRKCQVGRVLLQYGSRWLLFPRDIVLEKNSKEINPGSHTDIATILGIQPPGKITKVRQSEPTPIDAGETWLVVLKDGGVRQYRLKFIFPGSIPVPIDSLNRFTNDFLEAISRYVQA